MYVKRVILRDIRGFENLEFDLERPDGRFAGWTVLTGANGSGKSTILKAISVALVGTDAARALQPSFQRWVREGADGVASIKLDVVRNAAEDTLVGGGAPPASTFSVKIELKELEKDTTLQHVPPAAKKKYMTPTRGMWSPETKGWFSCGYGPFRRVFGASPEATKQMVSPSTERYATMFQEAASLSEVDQWLRNLRHKQLENRTSESEQLELVLEILRDELVPNNIFVDRVDSDGLWLRDGNGVRLSWHEMSDGYRAALALMTDVLRHLIANFGISDLFNRNEDGKIIIRKSGVVLIDEVDAHLHPSWQREIGFWMKRHFPNIQFIVTSHSPIICQAADENGLFVLADSDGKLTPRALTEDEYKRIIAAKPDEILLTPAFGLQNTRSPIAVQKRAEWTRLQSKRRAGGNLTKEESFAMQQLEMFATYSE